MNPLLMFPEEPTDKPEFDIGSGRYYARLSQTESIFKDDQSVSRIWLFDGFDADGFDEHSLPESEEGLADYYEKARLFVLEIKSKDSLAEKFHDFGVIEQADKEER